MNDISNKNIVAIIQARMGSSRLSNKMMICLNGYPVIEWVYSRVSKAKLLNRVVVAIPDTGRDDVLETHLKRMCAHIFRGSEGDVLSRFYGAAKSNSATHIVRVCADNPLICPEEIDNLIDFYLTNKCDYAFNQGKIGYNLYPDGLGAEIISFDILEKMYQNAELASQREHAFDYIWDNQDRFAIKTFDPPDKEIAFPNIKVDIDTYDDYKKFLSKDIKLDMTAREIISLFRD